MDESGTGNTTMVENTAGGIAALRPVERSVEEELFLELRLGSYILSEVITGYLTPSGLLLPLGGFSRALDFAITVTPESGTADGWFLSEERTFTLSVVEHRVVIEQEPKPFPAALVEIHEDDIYVDTRLFSEWFPIDVDFELSNLIVTVDSREPLPIEQRLKRERIQERSLIHRYEEQTAARRIEVPYRPVTWPFIDTSIETELHKNSDSDANVSTRYTSLLSGDLAYLGSRLFVAGNDRDELTDARLELTRKDPDGGLAGPLRLTEINLGDIADTQVSLISRSRLGRGALISNFPLDQPSEFDRITLRGEIPLGWDAELYRNEVLIDFQSAGDDGRYEFFDVPLLLGLNVLRVVLYGPQGQRRQDLRRILVGPGLVRPGETRYRLSVSQQNEDLLPVEDDTNDRNDPLQGEERVLAEVEQGITKALSLGATLGSLPLARGRRSYGGVNVRAALGPAYTRFDAVADDSGGVGVNGAVQMRLADNLGLSLEHGEFRDFASEQIADTDDPVQGRSRARLDTVLAPTVSWRVPFSLEAVVERRESGTYQADIANRLSTSLAGVSLSNNLAANLRRGGDDDSTIVDGTVLIGGWLGPVSLRGDLGYRVTPDAALTQTTLTGDWLIERDFTASLGVEHQLSGTEDTRVTAGLSRRFETVALGLESNVRDDGSFGALLSLSFALGREPRGGSWTVGSRPMANSGALSARVFLDRDNDGVFGPGDTPLEGVGLEGPRGHDPDAETGADGVVFITGMTPYRAETVGVETRTLEDPFWIPRDAPVTVVARPGTVAEVEFPIVATGEVDGTIYLYGGGAPRPASNVSVQLVDMNGEVVKTVTSAFDGFYLFDMVPPGRYRVRIDPEQAARLDLVAAPPIEVEVGGEDEIIAGQNFEIARASSPAGEALLAGLPPDSVAEAGESGPAANLPPALETAAGPPADGPAEPEPEGAGDRGRAARGDGRHWVQVAAYRNRALGEATWQRLRRIHAAPLDGREFRIRRHETAGDGVWYLFQFGDFADRAGAERLCAELEAAGLDCLVVTDEAVASR